MKLLGAITIIIACSLLGADFHKNNNKKLIFSGVFYEKRKCFS
mgnify:CR=1 FL=1